MAENVRGISSDSQTFISTNPYRGGPPRALYSRRLRTLKNVKSYFIYLKEICKILRTNIGANKINQIIKMQEEMQFFFLKVRIQKVKERNHTKRGKLCVEKKCLEKDKIPVEEVII